MSDEEIDLKGFYSKLSKNRFKVLSNGYSLDRWLFQVFMFLIFGWLFFVAYAHNFDLDYFKCSDPNSFYDSGLTCKNPFYEPTSWKNVESLPPGEYGTKPGPLFSSVFFVPVVLLIFGGLLNHLIHNRRRA